MKRSLNRLDLMVAYSCNIACRGCISLSDFARDGVAPTADIKSWIRHWAQLIEPRVLAVFGGEPCLHPDLLEICHAVRSAWPNTIIRLITNGYFLHKFDSKAWFDLAPFEMQVSIHRQDHERHINASIGTILKNRTDWKVSRHGGDHHKQMQWESEGIKIYKSIFKDFVQPYRLEGDKILPYTSDPQEAIKICGSPNTPILYKGLLYKCPPVANIIDLTKEQIEGYEPCKNADTLDEFVNNIGQAEKVCGRCPEQATAKIINHFDKKNVIVKNKITG